MTEPYEYDINRKSPEWLADAFKRKEVGDGVGDGDQKSDTRFSNLFGGDGMDDVTRLTDEQITESIERIVEEQSADPDIEVSVDAEGRTVHTTKVDLGPLMHSFGLLPSDHADLVQQLRDGGTDLCSQAAEAIAQLTANKAVDDKWHDEQVAGLNAEIDRLTEKSERWLVKCVEAEEKIEVLTVQRDRNEAGWKNQTDANTRLRVAVASAKLTLIKALM